MLDAYVSRRITRAIVYMTVTVTLYSRAEVGNNVNRSVTRHCPSERGREKY